MLQTRLFPDTHPEFLASKWPTFHDNRVGERERPPPTRSSDGRGRGSITESIAEHDPSIAHPSLPSPLLIKYCLLIYWQGMIQCDVPDVGARRFTLDS
ncbi:hypothetical protein PISMIDRAFT_156403 [Pisolithus microcarpus 441]|uniref:Uncharacterized protein n=1 Tax=Pisolithus microcarpus 441 TaxID=765257 RepID=A0A0C9Y3S8_9AGAM|nr:hypothetical protein PISMIDRAFT_156403 [Pisolithus microcarpus 441]